MPKDIDPYDYFAHEDEYPDADYEGACERLAAALRCKTVYTSAEGTDWGEFQKLQDLMQTSFPCIMSVGTFELVGHSVLITVPGSDPDLEAVQLIAHQDVVPVVCGTEDEWIHDAFSGQIDDEWVWGRGALDIKDMLMGELEASITSKPWGFP